VVWTRIESIIWSIFTVKVIDYRFRFLLSCDRHSCTALSRITGGGSGYAALLAHAG